MKQKTQQQQPVSAKKGKGRSPKGPWIFLGVSLLLYFLVLALDKEKAWQVAEHFWQLVAEIFPFLLVVFLLMVLIHYFLKTKTLIKYMGEGSGIKGWLIAIVTGILSVGAIYMWFPILKSMLEKGVKPGLVAVFLYNRGIKLHWLPLMALYFGMKYVVVLTLITVLVSVVQGLVIDFLLAERTRKAGKN